MHEGHVAEGHFYRDAAAEYVKGRKSVPVASGGAAIFSLLAYYKFEAGKRVALIQSNTMRALYTIPSLLEMHPRVVNSTYDDFLAMSPSALTRALDDHETRKSAVCVYSVIGGYLAPSFAEVARICREAGVPLIVDAAHAHYMPALTNDPTVQLAYSFYATKILPAGEGGLVATASEDIHTWVRRFLMYDRFENKLSVGLNMRLGELPSALIHRLMTDPSLEEYFKDYRIEVSKRWVEVCENNRVEFLDPRRAADYNGYKLIVLTPFERVKALNTPLTAHDPTSPVFGTDVRGGPSALPHWCPPTYPSLR